MAEPSRIETPKTHGCEHRGSSQRSGERENSLWPGKDVVRELARGAGQHRFGLGADGG